MPRLFPALAAASFLCVSGLAYAQSPANSPSTDTTPTVKLTAEQHHVIKEIVLKDMNVAKAIGNTPSTVGATVPENVQLHQFPPEIANRIPQVRSHVFFVKEDHVYIVSPKDKTIADVIN
jgi:poly-gamma-glutamate capsule biosynthesis protein CapA/YwtB (metallophosphatase superfamily)